MNRRQCAGGGPGGSGCEVRRVGGCSALRCPSGELSPEPSVPAGSHLAPSQGPSPIIRLREKTPTLAAGEGRAGRPRELVL